MVSLPTRTWTKDAISRNPFASTVTEYVPGKRAEKWYSPLRLLVADCCTPVFRFSRTRDAPRITAPLASVIRPLMAPVKTTFCAPNWKQNTESRIAYQADWRVHSFINAIFRTRMDAP